MENNIEAKYLIRNWEIPSGEIKKYDLLVYKDITLEEFQKMCGLIFKDLNNGK